MAFSALSSMLPTILRVSSSIARPYCLSSSPPTVKKV